MSSGVFLSDENFKKNGEGTLSFIKRASLETLRKTEGKHRDAYMTRDTWAGTHMGSPMEG